MSKDEINRLVSIWLDFMLSASSDAGWSGDGPLAMFIEYGQYVSTGYDRSNASMIHAIRLLRKKHADFRKVDLVLKELALESAQAYECVVIKNYLRGINRQTDKAWNDKERAEKLTLSYRQYQHFLAKAYRKMSQELRKYAAYTETV